MLAILCYDQKSASEIAALVPSKHYDPGFREIAEEAEKYLSGYGKPSGSDTLHIIQALQETYPDKEEAYERIYKSLQVSKEQVNKEYVLEQAKVFVRYQQLKQALNSAVKQFQKQNEEGLLAAEAILHKALNNPNQEISLGLELSNPEQALSFLHKEEAQSFSTGIKALDDKGLGPARKRLNLFIGLAGAGKSWWLCHLAKHAYISRQKVLYISLELSEDEVSQRMIQGLFSVSKRDPVVKICSFESNEYGKFLSIRTGDELKRRTLAEPEAPDFLYDKIQMLQKRPPFFIKEFPTGSLSIKELENYLDILEAKRSFIPDLLIIDYADLMQIDTKNYRLDVGQIYKKLRGLAIKRNLAVATASQANRAAVKSKWITGDNAAEDFSKIATSDVVITYNQTNAEHQLGLGRLWVAKGRTDKDKFAILISQAYGVGQFVLDSVEYTPNYWTDLDSQVTDAVNPNEPM